MQSIRPTTKLGVVKDLGFDRKKWNNVPRDCARDLNDLAG